MNDFISNVKEKSISIFNFVIHNPVNVYVLLFLKPISDMFYKASLFDFLILAYALLVFGAYAVKNFKSFKDLRYIDYLTIAMLAMLTLSLFKDFSGFRIYVKTASQFLIFLIGRYCKADYEKSISVLRASSLIVIFTNFVCLIIGLFNGWGFCYWGDALTFRGLYYFKTDLAIAMLMSIIFILAAKSEKLYEKIINAVFVLMAIYIILTTNARISFLIAFIVLAVIFLELLENKLKLKKLINIIDIRTIAAVFLCAVMSFGAVTLVSKLPMFDGNNFIGFDIDKVTDDVEGSVPGMSDGEKTEENEETVIFGVNISKIFSSVYTPSNTQGRSQIWAKLFEKFGSASIVEQIFGIDLTSDQFAHQPEHPDKFVNSHSAYFKTLYSTGFIGVMIFVLFLFAIIYKSRNMKNRRLFFTVLQLLGLILASSLFNNSHEYTMITWMPMFFIGLMFAKEDDEEGKRRFEKEIECPEAFENPRRFFESKIFVLLCLTFSIFCVSYNLYIFALLGYIAVLCAILVFCKSIVPTTAPFVLMTVTLSMCYDSFDKFVKYWWLIFAVFPAFAYHFIRYRKKVAIGETFKGIGAVSIALLLGGVGFISAKDYFNPIALYYTLGLGLGMMLVYIIIKSQVEDDPLFTPDRLMFVFYAVGVLAAFCILKHYIIDWDVFWKSKKVLSNILPRNNCSTFLIFAIPAAMYFARKNKLHLISMVLFYAAIVFSGSRGGLICGAAEILICLVVLGIYEKNRAFKIAYFSVAGIAAILAIAFAGTILSFYSSRYYDTFVDDQDTRMRFLYRLKDNFLSNPIFGQGLGTSANADIYTPKKGALAWYHMMIPQIIGSLGIVGILGYGYQIYNRISVIVKKLSFKVAALATIYIGIFAMSQVNPGEFCPLPYQLLLVMIFICIENQIDTKTLKEKLSAELE